jgi:hypothetical protein
MGKHLLLERCARLVSAYPNGVSLLPIAVSSGALWFARSADGRVDPRYLAAVLVPSALGTVAGYFLARRYVLAIPWTESKLAAGNWCEVLAEDIEREISRYGAAQPTMTRAFVAMSITVACFGALTPVLAYMVFLAPR